MTNMPNPFDDDTELWETRQLGASEEYVRVVSPEKTKAIHEVSWPSANNYTVQEEAS